MTEKRRGFSLLRHSVQQSSRFDLVHFSDFATERRHDGNTNGGIFVWGPTHEPPFYEFVDALTSLVTIVSSPLNFDAEPDSIESIERFVTVPFHSVTRGCILLRILNISIRSIRNSSSSLAISKHAKDGQKRFDRERKKKNKRTHFSRFIISLNLIRIKGKKKKKKILKNTFDRFKSKFEHWRQRCASKLAI